FDLAWHFNFDTNYRPLFDPGTLAGMEGYQIVTRRFFNGSFLLKHDLGKRVSLTHGATFLNKYDYYYSQGATTVFDSYEHITRQLQYYAGLAINPGGGFTIMPAFHFLNFSSPRLVYRERGFGSMFVVPAKRDNYMLGRLSLFKHVWLLDNGLGLTASNLNNQNQYEADYTMMLYPLGNLNLYIGGTAYGLIEDPGTMSEDRRFAGQGLLGFSVTPEIWIETTVLAGNIKNMATHEGFIVYNGSETVTGKYELSLIIPTGEMTFSLRGALLNYYSTFTDSQGFETNLNKLEFNGLTLIGGLKWNF
ncbi:MAG TPA: hypothetical protein VE870_05655, partial [Bacteroidales bacterium]|nr:hypothetical protein [Bacteroidales bacterium]